MATLARTRAGCAIPSRWVAGTTSGRPCARQSKGAVVARDSTKFQLAAEDGDYAPGIAAGLFVAAKQGAFQATAENLRYAIAIAALVLPVVNIVFRREWTNRDVGTLAPVALATEALNIASVTPAAIAAFGTALCGSLSKMLNVNGAFYGVLASLAFSVYAGYSTQWISAALLILYGYQFVTSAKNSEFMLAPGAAALAALYALYRYFADNCTACVSDLAACFVIARLGWSVFAILRKVGEKESD